LFITLGAAVIMSRGARIPWMFLLAPPLVAVGGLLDAFDGIVARVQNRTSRLGDFLDHVFDRIVDVGLLAGWWVGARIRPDLALFTLACVTLFGYLGTQIEATFGVRTYEGTGRGEYVIALVVLPMIGYINATTSLSVLRLGALSLPECATMLLTVATVLALVQRFRLALRLARSMEDEGESKE